MSELIKNIIFIILLLLVIIMGYFTLKNRNKFKKKYRGKIILTTLLSLISSCSKPYFVEKEGFVFDPSEYILKRDKTEEIIDYYKAEYSDIDYEYGLSLSPLTCSPEEIMVKDCFFKDEQVHSLVDLYDQCSSDFDYYPYALGNVCKEFKYMA